MYCVGVTRARAELDDRGAVPQVLPGQVLRRVLELQPVDEDDVGLREQLRPRSACGSKVCEFGALGDDAR